MLRSVDLIGSIVTACGPPKRFAVTITSVSEANDAVEDVLRPSQEARGFP